jgi:hypothetical protein
MTNEGILSIFKNNERYDAQASPQRRVLARRVRARVKPPSEILLVFILQFCGSLFSQFQLAKVKFTNWNTPVSVIDYCNLGFICDLVLEIWKLCPASFA